VGKEQSGQLGPLILHPNLAGGNTGNMGRVPGTEDLA
jgi:hypothetical protein